MEANQLIKKFPEIVVAMSELGSTLVTLCHDPDPEQMQNKLGVLLAEGFVGAPFVSNSVENAKSQETFVQKGILLVMAQVYDSDKEVMLANFRCLSEITPEEAMRIAREEEKNKQKAFQPAT